MKYLLVISFFFCLEGELGFTFFRTEIFSYQFIPISTVCSEKVDSIKKGMGFVQLLELANS